jgi:hypothetical protein
MNESFLIRDDLSRASVRWQSARVLERAGKRRLAVYATMTAASNSGQAIADKADRIMGRIIRSKAETGSQFPNLHLANHIPNHCVQGTIHVTAGLPSRVA